jgi:hypothetical protein
VTRPTCDRSRSRATGAVHVNVHVGGVARSRDGGRTWAPTVDIEVDVHQILAHPRHPDVVLAAAADGFGLSRDGGDSWRFVADGMHAHYLRAVAVSDDSVLVSASTGPGGRRAAIYRRRLDDDGPFERCTQGLPAWFGDNVDTGCLAAARARRRLRHRGRARVPLARRRRPLGARGQGPATRHRAQPVMTRVPHVIRGLALAIALASAVPAPAQDAQRPGDDRPLLPGRVRRHAQS